MRFSGGETARSRPSTLLRRNLFSVIARSVATKQSPGATLSGGETGRPSDRDPEGG